MPLIKLLADPEDDTIPPPPPMVHGGNFPIEDLLLDRRARKQRLKREIAIVLSVLAHLCILLLLLFTPKLFAPVVIPVSPAHPQPQQLTFLELPPSLVHKPKPQHPKALSDQNREFKHTTPITSSISGPGTPARRPRNGARPRGTPQPHPAAPQPPAGRPAPEVAQSRPAPAAPKSESKAPGEAPKPQASAGLHLENVPKPAAHPRLNLNLGAANSLERALQQAARDHASHPPGILMTQPLPARPQSGNPSAAPGQTGAGVQILTNTEGVDFNPYLRQVIEIVRRNWYAVMPETVYLGTQGKVVLIFNINRNGSVPGIHPVGLASTASLNQAAEAAVSASNPFPPLPKEFHGPFITLQFSFYYNLTPGQ